MYLWDAYQLSVPSYGLVWSEKSCLHLLVVENVCWWDRLSVWISIEDFARKLNTRQKGWIFYFCWFAKM